MKTFVILLFQFVLLPTGFTQIFREYELRAHYPLQSDGKDITGNYDSIDLHSPVFADGGIVSPGCYFLSGDFDSTCLIQTRKIDAFYDPAFVIELDFKVSAYSRPIFMMRSRFLGVGTNSDGSLHLWTHSNVKDTIENIHIEKDTWYNLIVIYIREASSIWVYLDKHLIFTKGNFLNHLVDFYYAALTNQNYANGVAFKGSWKDLKIYSHRNKTSTSVTEMASHQCFFYPNPASDILNLVYPFDQPVSYRIVDPVGETVIQSVWDEGPIQIQRLNKGIYLILLISEGKLMYSNRFVKL